MIRRALVVSACLAGWAKTTLAAESLPPNPSTAQVEYLDLESQKLRAAVASPVVSDLWIHRRAGTLFERIPRQETVRGSIRAELRGWRKPAWATPGESETRTGRSDQLMGAFGYVLRSREVPTPWRGDLEGAFETGEALRQQGKMGLDGESGSRRLASNVMGAYFYVPHGAFRPLRIVYNEALQTIGRFLGDRFAAATAVHESGHARDDAQGNLSPEQEEDGEVRAFMTEYRYLRSVDPTGEILAWLSGTFGPSRWVPRGVSDYLFHLRMLRVYGDRGDIRGLVHKLAYGSPRHPPRTDPHRG